MSAHDQQRTFRIITTAAATARNIRLIVETITASNTSIAYHVEHIAEGQCCPCCFFPLDLGFFCFIWGSVFFIENLSFFWLWSNFRNVCCITVFSFQEYSNFTGV